ncbi:hypothetical protein GCM10025298_17830 [Natronobiforma cellulositropha]
MRDVGAFVEGAPDEDLADVETAYLECGGEFLVGEFEGRIVAMGAFRPADGYVTDFLPDLEATAAEVTRMRVDPAHQRRGYGRTILDELERRARERGVTELVLDTTPVQAGAIALYESRGYALVHRERATDFGETLEMLFYRKGL